MFYERFLYLCNKKRLSPSAAAERAGFNRGTVSVWKKKYEQKVDVRPEPEVCSKICAFFDCSEPWLLGMDDESKKTASLSGSGNEEEFIQLLSMLSPEERDRELAYLRDLVKRRDIPAAD